MKVTLTIDPQLLLRWLLAGLLAWAAMGKIANLQEFHATMLAYRLPMPGPLVRLAVITLPWLELLCAAILLVTSGLRRAGLLWSVLLCAGFVFATGQAWARGLEISCGCFKLDFLGEGAARQVIESVQFAFVRAALLLAAAVYLFRTDPARQDDRTASGA